MFSDFGPLRGLVIPSNITFQTHPMSDVIMEFTKYKCPWTAWPLFFSSIHCSDTIQLGSFPKVVSYLCVPQEVRPYVSPHK